MSLQVGLKFWPADMREFMAGPRYEEVLGMIDFVEIMAIRGEDISFLEGFSKPITVHCMHSYPGFFFNPGNPSKKKENRNLLDFALKSADTLGSDIIVVHPGFLEKGSSPEAAGEFLKSFKDSRIRIETMPFETEGMAHLGRDPEGMGKILRISGKGLCLDLSHAFESSLAHGRDGMEFIREFLGMGPDYFHISDTDVDRAGRPVEFHKHLGEGMLDMMAMRDALPEGARVCLETPMDLDGRVRDIKFLRGAP